MISAFTALAHNGNLINKAETILQQMAENENCYMYLVNPDGTRVRILPGCRIESYEYVVLHREEA